MVDAALEGDGPASVDEGAFDGDFELDAGMKGAVGGKFFFGAGAEFVMPVLAELGAPESLRATTGFLRAEGKIGEFPDADGGGFIFEGELHQRWLTEHRDDTEGKREAADYSRIKLR